MVNLLICGIGGKMGRAVLELASKTDGVKVVCGVDKVCFGQVFPCPVYMDFKSVSEKVDVIIDFSRPQAMPEILSYAKAHNVGAVFATTGYSVDEIESIRLAANEIPVFLTANFSLGVNLLAMLCKRAAQVLGEDYDIEIIEKHHRQKVDAPSGTALFLADEINDAFCCNKEYVYGRYGGNLKRGGEIGIHAVRGGTIIGEHDVIFTANDETITLSHSAQSKALFASGALKAAIFLKDKPPKQYQMNDLLQSLL